MQKVTVLVDNGESFSDHTIHFVEVQACFLRDFETLLSLNDAHAYKIIAIADKLKWRKKNSAVDDVTFQPFHWFNDIDVDKWKTIDRRYRRRLLQRWARDTPRYKLYKNDFDRLKAVR